MARVPETFEPRPVPHLQSPAKKVRFAAHPHVYTDISWAHSNADALSSSDSALLPLQSTLRESAYDLRTEIRVSDPTTVAGVIILMVALLFLFLMIWFIVQQILLLEVESEIGKSFKPSKPRNLFVL
jgi:hypothetical protein